MNCRAKQLEGNGCLHGTYHADDKRVYRKNIVHVPEKIDGEREQQVDIYLKFIGKFDPPMPELTEEEIRQQERAKKRRAYYRERGRRWRAKEKEKRLQEQESE